MKTVLVSLLGLWLPLAGADVVEHTFNLGWRFLSPDGFGRPVITVNGQWPAPTIRVKSGDRLVVHVNNGLGNETATIHWHGMLNFGANHMDGPAMVTQCPISPGSSFTYDFQIQRQVGTYWWHAHIGGQLNDGLRGPLIVEDPDFPYQHRVTGGDLVVTVNDWYHDQAPELISYYQSKKNNDDGGAEPIPDAGLINDGHDIKLDVKPGRTYYLRVLNIGTFVGAYLEFDSHSITIIEADGIYVDPKTVDRLYLTVGQRYGVLLTSKSNSNRNFLIRGALDLAMFDDVPKGYNPAFYGWLVYDSTKTLPKKTPMANLDVFDDMSLSTATCNKYDQVDVYQHVDRQIIIDMDFTTINDMNRAIINNVTYIQQKVPTLYTALSAGNEAWNPEVYGRNTNPFVVGNGQVIEVIINNHDDGNHPWHLHGHTFQVIARNAAKGGYYTGQKLSPPHARPLRRDTVTVNANGFVAVRFKADNPGVYLMHCHIDWHVEAGLTLTFVESPDILQRTLRIPSDHLRACQQLGIPTKGNAAGNNKNYLDLTGAPTVPPKDPHGALIDKSSVMPPKKRYAYWPGWRGHRKG